MNGFRARAARCAIDEANGRFAPRLENYEEVKSFAVLPTRRATLEESIDAGQDAAEVVLTGRTDDPASAPIQQANDLLEELP
jgi:hypothetical protein